MDKRLQLKSTIKYPTSLIVNGASPLGLEIASALMEQGGYVVLIDTFSEETVNAVLDRVGDQMLFSFLDYSAIPHLEEDLRRLDYVFYLSHESIDPEAQLSTQNFLKYSNYLDTSINLAVKFEAKFLLTTAIRAHQLLLAHLDREINQTGDHKRPAYTEMELQKYSESLCTEYAHKANLNLRVVRVAELLGEDVQLAQNTTLTQLLFAAVQGKDLPLRNDGLEEGWYVHAQDAAYGLIKAQFSKETEGQVYTLAYEYPITALSLAYKIQELEPNAREITFVQEEKSFLPLRLYKPAPNLINIGWRPKVALEEALQESLEMAKVVQAEKISSGGEGTDVMTKLRSFLNVAQDNPVVPFTAGSESGPLARLIAERKRQEEARAAAVGVADAKLKDARRPQRNLSGTSKFNRWLWSNVFDPRTSFSPLRRITVGQVLFYTIVLAFVTYLYFALFAPLIVVGRNVLIIHSSLGSLQTAVGSQDVQAVEREAATLQYAFTETTQMLAMFRAPAQTLALETQLNSITDALQVYATFAEGVRNIAYANIPLAEYLDKYTDNLRFRISDESYLAATVGTDYSTILDELELRRAYADIGQEQLDRVNAELTGGKSLIVPESLKSLFSNVNAKLLAASSAGNLGNVALYAGDSLGARIPRTYLFILVDNSKPMPIGGELAAYLQLTMQNGSIADIKLQPIDSIVLDAAKLPSYASTEINLRSATNISPIGIGDFAMIGQFDTFSTLLKEVWQKRTGATVDQVGVLNFESLGRLLLVSGPVTVEGEEYTGANLLTNLEQAVAASGSPSAQRRHDLVAQVWATALDKIMDNWDTNLWPALRELATSTANKDLVLAKSNMPLGDLINEAGLYGDTALNTDIFLSPFFIRNGSIVSGEDYPAFNQTTQVTMGADSSLSVKYTLRFASLQNISAVGLCAPRTAINLAVSGIPSNRQVIREHNNVQCAIINVSNETELQFTFGTLQFESSAALEYNLAVGFSKAPGSAVRSGVEIILAPELTLTRISPAVETLDGRLALSTDLSQDQKLEITVRKK